MRAVAILLAAACPALVAQGSASLVIRNVRVIDGTGAPARDGQTIVIADGLIQSVGATTPAGGTAIDGTGLTALPGLADLHVHLQGGWDGERPDYLNFGRYLDSFLYNGVTTVLDAGNSMPFVTQVKQEIEAGRLRGPRVFTAGPMIDSAQPIWPPLAEPMADYAHAPGVIRRLAENHVDFAKAYAGLSDLHIRALADAARPAGLRLIADTWERNGSLSLVRTGLYAFAHAPHAVPMTDQIVSEMRARGMAVVTTVAVRESFANRRLQDLAWLDQPLVRDVTPPHLLEEMREASRAGAFKANADYETTMRLTAANVLALWRGGVLVAAGTDAPYPGVFQGEGLHRELELLVEAGLTPLEAIRSATQNAARFVHGEQAGWGAIRAGQRADLVLVSGRPDQRIGETRTIVSVIQQGRVIDRAALKVAPGEPAYRTSQTLMQRTQR
jgi:imidazolonepropionase-like amidohydrolase